DRPPPRPPSVSPTWQPDATPSIATTATPADFRARNEPTRINRTSLKQSWRSIPTPASDCDRGMRFFKDWHPDRTIMRYISTRGEAPELGFRDVLLAGLGRDGGLYLPAEWPQLDHADIRNLRGLS